MTDLIKLGSKDWWPMCAKCKKVVDELVILPVYDPLRHNRSIAFRSMGIREYEIKCHGSTERNIIGFFGALELAQQRKRLQDAFRDKGQHPLPIYD